MNNLRLENNEKILELIRNYSKENNVDYEYVMNEIYDIITEEIDKSTHFDIILQKWQKESNQMRYSAEEEIFHVVSIEIEKEIRNNILNNVDQEELKELNNFLIENYKEIFQDYYKNNKTINEDDFDDCVLAISKSYEIEPIVSEIFVSMFVEKEILGLNININI